MTTQEVKRKLTAILSADVKGYSRLMNEEVAEKPADLIVYGGVGKAAEFLQPLGDYRLIVYGGLLMTMIMYFPQGLKGILANFILWPFRRRGASILGRVARSCKPDFESETKGSFS